MLIGSSGSESKESGREVMKQIACVLAVMISLVVVLFFVSKENKASQDDYQRGIIEGIRIARAASELKREETAMLWWSGANDLQGARERLCKNYYPPRTEKGKK